MAEQPTTRSRLKIADLVDLELQLQEDQTSDISALRKRDAEIGTTIGADQLQPPALLAAWLDELRRGKPQDETTGQKAQRYLELTGLLLFVVGVLMGVGAVAPWLGYDPERPVNVIFFWSSLVGFQIILLMLWIIAMLPAKWLAALPGGQAVQTLLRGIGRIPPTVMLWLANRVSGDYRQVIEMVRGEARRLEWLYGKLRLWLLVRLTQIFAVAFNVGAIGAFVLFSYINDPAFGWKSTMLRDDTLHSVVKIIGAPWSSWSPQGIPDNAEVAETRYESLDKKTWPNSAEGRCWQPFLLASLVLYGLLPRIITCLFSDGKVRSSIRNAKFGHHDVQKLVDRLRRPLVETTALAAEAESDRLPPANGDGVGQGDLNLTADPVVVLRWAGVRLQQQQLEKILFDQIGVRVEAVFTIGSLDAEEDQHALAALSNGMGQGQVVILVEAWEPPVAEYVDLLNQIRARMGDGFLMLVLLYHRDQQGAVVPPTEQDTAIWRHCLGSLGDPWLAVRPLIEPASP